MLDRPTRIFVFILLLLGLARHLWLAWYVHPFADDFSYAVAGMRTELWARLVQEYTSWNGRYFSNILLLRGPLVLGMSDGSILYRSAAIALITFTCLAAYRFLVQTFGEALSTGTRWMIALIFVLLFLHCMPDASEGFYWYTGAMTYQLPNVLSLFLFGNWIVFHRRGGTPGIGWILAQVPLIVVIAGCSELHMALLVLVHSAPLIHRSIRSKRFDPSVTGLFLVALACGAVVFAAPGNATRGALFPHQHEFLRTLGYSVAQTVRFSGTWLVLSPLVLFSFAVVAFHRTMGSEGAFSDLLKRANKWLVLALPFAVVFVSMVVTYWPTGLLGQYRTANVACFYFIPTWCFAALVWDVQVFRTWGWLLPDPRTRAFQWSFVLLCAVSFFFFGRDGLVTSDLLSGRAQRYDRGIQEGYGMITEAVRNGADHVELRPVEIPLSLHILPLDTSPDHWLNRSLADYFGNAALDITVGQPLPKE